MYSYTYICIYKCIYIRICIHLSFIWYVCAVIRKKYRGNVTRNRSRMSCV